MDESKLKWLLAAVAVLLLLVLTPLFILSLAAQDEQNRKTALAGCVPGANGEQMQVPPEYQPMIDAAAKEANFPPAVIAAQLWTESRFDPNAYQPSSGAAGIAQFVPIAWAEYGNGGDRYNPADAIAAQGRLLKDLQVRYLGDLITNDQERIELTLAAYNAGQDVVLKARGIPNIPETQNYVRQITQMAQVNYASCQSVVPIGDLGTGKWVHPLAGSTVTSLFGHRGCIQGLKCTASLQNHTGMDFSTPSGNGTVVAPADMRVTVVDTNTAEGYGVKGTSLDNPDMQFMFIHCAVGSHRISVGQTLTPGTPICTEGATGNASREHLHFTIFYKGTEVDPEPILLAKGIQLTYREGLK